MTVIDYDRMQRVYPKQKAALTRAVNHWRKTGDGSKVEKACREAVREWDEIGCWPDSWANWQVALDDTRHWNDQTDLRDL